MEIQEHGDNIKFSNTYAQLGDVFSEKTNPLKVENPELLLWNTSLADQLRVPQEWQNDSGKLAAFFSGNQNMSDSEPIAIAYAGHQFGNFVPQLGDGRAHLLGEVFDIYNNLRDIQLKGSGRTRFSRRGDGRCAVGPAVREYIMSEALFSLGVPTTRSLAVVTTGESVFRQKPLPGAVVTRIASSHLRVGTFQYFAAREDQESLKKLADFTIDRHYPALQQKGRDRFVMLLDRVIEKQIQLVVEWMRIGFIHGVMNTDNTTISGETIDFGPCAMMGVYDPQTVFSSIDSMGRYAFGNQPHIIQWNMARFAECLLPLLHDDPEKALPELEPLIAGFQDRFKTQYLKMMGRKLGWKNSQEGDQKTISEILNQFRNNRMDYTSTFEMMTDSLVSDDSKNQVQIQLKDSYNLWQKRLEASGLEKQESHQLMCQNNPLVIPRNHHVEKLLREIEDTGVTENLEIFLEVLRSPYEKQAHTSLFQDLPEDQDQNYRTFCGT